MGECPAVAGHFLLRHTNRMLGIIILILILAIRLGLMWVGGREIGWPEVWLPIGMVIGWGMVSIESLQVFKKAVGDIKLPIENVLVGVVVAIVGVWMTYSVASVLGIGMILGLGWRLWSMFAEDKQWQNWYWVFKRKFSSQEHLWVQIGWLGLLVVQSLRVV